MIIFINVVFLLLSFYLLAVVCDRYFVNSLDSIAQKLKMNSDMAGATLMAVGSSAPELFVSFMALFKPGNEAMGAGTIVGSALFNILVIIGASAMVKKAFIAWQPVIRDIIFYSLSIILLIFSFRDGSISLSEASIFVISYIVYVIAVMKWKKILPYKDESKDAIEDLEKGIDKSEKNKTIFGRFISVVEKILDFIFPNPKYYWWVFFVSIVIIAGLSWVLVESAVVLAVALNIPAVIIGLTILAAGTSIPDLMSSIIVAKQGRGGMAISNAIGSNIFDILIGLGLPWLLVLTFSGKIITVANENINSSIILLFATVIAILFLLFIRKWKIGKFSGLIMIALYLGYLTWAIIQVL
ncbi:MAG: calcium/sodium antiporter [Candidatus Paceibacterota bacterium]